MDDGDEENNWRRATEYVDDGGWAVSGSDCDRDGDETIDEGTRGGFRVDDSAFEFKKLSIREIDAGQGPEIAAEEGEEGDDIEETEVHGEETQGGWERLDEIEALANLKQLAEMADITDVEELEEIAQVEELEEIARAPDLEGLAGLVGASDTEDLLELVIP